MQKALIFAISILAIASCGQQQASTEETPAASVVTLPENWQDALRGQQLSTTFTNIVTSCRGNLETIERTSAGVHVLGWGFNATTNDGYATILSTDATGAVNGYGSTIADRPDVGRTIEGVTAAHIGMEVWSTQTSGEIVVYGVDWPTQTACRLGSIGL